MRLFISVWILLHLRCIHMFIDGIWMEPNVLINLWMESYWSLIHLFIGVWILLNLKCIHMFIDGI